MEKGEKNRKWKSRKIVHKLSRISSITPADENSDKNGDFTSPHFSPQLIFNSLYSFNDFLLNYILNLKAFLSYLSIQI